MIDNEQVRDKQIEKITQVSSLTVKTRHRTSDQILTFLPNLMF
jgi:hypothetical protein